MAISDEPLDYLHDADVKNLVFGIGERGIHELLLELICHPDAGYSPWDGKVLRLRARDLLVCHVRAYGYSAGPDCVDTCTLEVTPAFAQDVSRLLEFGMRAPEACIRLKLNSGTDIEFACYEAAINVLDDGPD